MAKTFKNGIELHRLLQTAPLQALEPFLANAEGGKYAEAFAGAAWASAVDDGTTSALRDELVDLAHELKSEDAAPLDRHAHRVLTLADGRGVELINRVGEKLFDQTRAERFAEQLDALGRSLWLYGNEAKLFDEAECLYYADYYRNLGRMYEAFELDTDAAVEFVWDDAVKAALEKQIPDKLELTGRCTVTHLQVTCKGQDGTEQQQHLVIVRHGGPLSSVAEFHENDGSRGERYYRPLNEATLLYSPDEGLLEVFSASPSVRQQIATCFAEAGLRLNLSDRPLMLKQYNFSPFLTSLSLSTPSIRGFDIERAAVVEIDVRPDNLKHRAGLKVTISDDIEAVATALFGTDNLFRRAASLARIVIAVRYTAHGTDKARTLAITLSEPNRCNLRSNRDPVQRDLGYALLTAWKILNPVKPMEANQVHALFPALLQLFDQSKSEVPGQFFLTRGFDRQALLDGCFLEPRGRYTSLLFDEEGVTHEVEIKFAGKPGLIYYAHPSDGTTVEIPAAAAEKFAVRRDWLDEMVLKQFRRHLITVALVKLDDQLTYLGDIQLGDDVVPCYLARDLKTPATLRRLDIALRARNDKCIGLVLSAGRDIPLCLGTHVIAAVEDYLTDGDDEAVLDVKRLAVAYIEGRPLARGGKVLEIVKNGRYSAALRIPGKGSLALSGPKAIAFFQELVKAANAGAPLVPVKQLLAAAGSSSGTPRQLLGAEFWDSILGVWVGPPAGGTRGSYQLLLT